MNKYNCTYNSGDYLYRVAVVAGEENTARDIAADAADRKWPGYGLAKVRWNVAVAKISVYEPAGVLDINYLDLYRVAGLR